MNKRKIEYRDLFNFKYYSDPQISPDGSNVAFVCNIAVEKEDGYESSIWLQENNSDAYELLGNALCPRWYGDGKSIAFLRSENGVKQVFKINLNDKMITKVSDAEYGVDYYILSPDGGMICYISSVAVREGEGKCGAVYVNSLQYKADEVKGLKSFDSAAHIFISETKNNSVKKLTPDNFVLEAAGWYTMDEPCWSHDGKLIAFSSRLQDDDERDMSPWKSDIFVIDTDNKAVKRITDSNGVFIKPTWSHDDNDLIFAGHFNEYYRATDFSLYKACLTDGQINRLPYDMDITVTDYCNSDSVLGRSADCLRMNEDSSKIYFTASNRGNTDLFEYDVNTGSLVNLNKVDRRIYGFTLCDSSNKAAIVYTSADKVSVVSVMDLSDCGEKVICDGNAKIMEEIELSVPESTRYTSDDFTEQEGWIMKPVGFKEGNKYAGILQIHGGPFTFYGNAFVFEFQLMAAAGYNVMYCNPRGSKGYGQKLAAAVLDNYSKRDYSDIMKFVGHCLNKFEFIDSTRLGVTGGSYGGYMTNWIVTQTNMFKAAVAQRSISNWMTMYATSDMGYVSIEQMMLGRKMHRLEELLEFSPVIYADKVRTPLLLMHSEKDMRCPIEQAEQFYTVLKHKGKNVSLLRFPESNHGLSRNGIPSLRIERLKNIIEFMKKYIDTIADECQ